MTPQEIADRLNSLSSVECVEVLKRIDPAFGGILEAFADLAMQFIDGAVSEKYFDGARAGLAMQLDALFSHIRDEDVERALQEQP